MDWANETQTYAVKAYASAESGEKLEVVYHNIKDIECELGTKIKVTR